MHTGVVRRALLAAAAATVAAAAAGVAPAGRQDVGLIEISFAHESYAPRTQATLHLYSPTRGGTLQILHSGPEPGHTTRRDVVHGVAVGQRTWVGTKTAGAVIRVTVGDWPSGLYFARVVDADGRVGYAPFVLRPRRLGHHRIAIVLPTQTWQAYNLRDDDGDGRADTWYARAGSTVRLNRPFARPRRPASVPPLRPAASSTGSRAAGSGATSSPTVISTPRVAATLADAYDLIVFPGHEEYVTTRQYDAIEAYRDAGGNLMFLTGE